MLQPPPPAAAAASSVLLSAHSVCLLSQASGEQLFVWAPDAADNIQPWNVTSEPRMTLTLEGGEKHTGSQEHSRLDIFLSPLHP